ETSTSISESSSVGAGAPPAGSRSTTPSLSSSAGRTAGPTHGYSSGAKASAGAAPGAGVVAGSGASGAVAGSLRLPPGRRAAPSTPRPGSRAMARGALTIVGP